MQYTFTFIRVGTEWQKVIERKQNRQTSSSSYIGIRILWRSWTKGVHYVAYMSGTHIFVRTFSKNRTAHVVFYVCVFVAKDRLLFSTCPIYIYTIISSGVYMQNGSMTVTCSPCMALLIDCVSHHVKEGNARWRGSRLGELRSCLYLKGFN